MTAWSIAAVEDAVTVSQFEALPLISHGRCGGESPTRRPGRAGAASGGGGRDRDQEDRIFQKMGPTGSLKSPRATKYPSSFTVMGRCGSGRAAGPEIGFAESVIRNFE
ncbi:hypothetical protein PA7_28550 [Pseudonocardia asaccharolytica DSM 44247 = NBRC 16224]|uniref:Uncharacterized protein n=1 Tax=Pseudonocardia asaccharolytica DSM 44247 = NBRC 16224 TaxID=1123024 RepID=A0A511D7V8_9PSEU|nr:hypothetical protein PA7_28550 [Pseudonocardia asaccharolytica DSM 44247 = NBRC 16224]